MKRRLILALLALLLLSAAAGLAHAQDAPPYRIYLPLLLREGRPLLIAGLHYDGIITGEPDEAFQLYNPNAYSVSLAGWRVRSGSRTVTFPAGMSMEARSSLWCGREAVAFGRSFGHPPSCEWAVDTDPNVPNLVGTGLTFSNAGAAVLLLRPDGTASDVLVYKAGAIPPEGGWRGPALYPYKPSSAFHEQGQVLYRKLKPEIYRSLDNRIAEPQGDTDTRADWASEPADVLEGRRVKQVDRLTRGCGEGQVEARTEFECAVRRLLQREAVWASARPVADGLPGLARPQVGPDPHVAERRERGVIEADGAPEVAYAQRDVMQHVSARRPSAW